MWLLDVFMLLDFVLLIGEILKLISKREDVIMKDFWYVFIYWYSLSFYVFINIEEISRLLYMLIFVYKYFFKLLVLLC